jgi:alpha-tubulin suppressor-like RCC1 family protein
MDQKSMRISLNTIFRWSLTACLLFYSALTVAPTLTAVYSPVEIDSQRKSEEAEEEIKRLIVMIKSQFDGAETIGAGIIIGAENDQLYIATAQHLVSLRGQDARQIDVYFKWLNDPVKATLLKHTGRPLDLAVLSVDSLKKAGISIQQLSLEQLGNAESLKRGDPVYSLGNPHGKAWSVNVTPDRVSQREGDLVYFESNFIREGHSGGALLNGQWELVGMILSDQPPNGEAISITRILVMAREWKFPVGLRNRIPLPDRQLLSAGGEMSCVITDGGSAYCWGDNTYGRLGNGSETNSILPVPVYGNLSFASVSAGTVSTCGVTARGVAYCWGSNESGELGHSSEKYKYSSVPIPVSGGFTFRSISAGHAYACGVTTGGAAYCWGSNQYGQLGSGSKTDSNIPVAVAGKLNFKSMSTGYGHTCGITTKGSAYCWGNNGSGQLGNGSENDSTQPVPVSGGLAFTSISPGWAHTCGTTTDGRAYCWGNNTFGQLGDGPKSAHRNVPFPVSGGLTFKSVSARRSYTCGITTAGALYSWGSNFDPTTGVNVPSLVTDELKFTAISAGYDHFCGIATSNAIYCWGSSPGNGANNVRVDQPSLIPLPR